MNIVYGDTIPLVRGEDGCTLMSISYYVDAPYYMHYRLHISQTFSMTSDEVFTSSPYGYGEVKWDGCYRLSTGDWEAMEKGHSSAIDIGDYGLPLHIATVEAVWELAGRLLPGNDFSNFKYEPVTYVWGETQ